MGAGVLLALSGPRDFLEGMRKALFGEFVAACDEALFIGVLGWEDGDYVVFGVGFVALLMLDTTQKLWILKERERTCKHLSPLSCRTASSEKTCPQGTR